MEVVSATLHSPGIWGISINSKLKRALAVRAELGQHLGPAARPHPGSAASSVQPGRSHHGSEPSLLSSHVLPCPPQAPRGQQQSTGRPWANRNVKPQTCPCLAGPRLRPDWGTGVPLESSHSPSLGLRSESTFSWEPPSTHLPIWRVRPLLSFTGWILA